MTNDVVFRDPFVPSSRQATDDEYKDVILSRICNEFETYFDTNLDMPSRQCNCRNLTMQTISVTLKCPRGNFFFNQLSQDRE